MRDVESDRKANRKTLPIRFGRKVSFIILCGFMLLPSLLSSIWIMMRGDWIVGVLPLFVLPASIRLLLDILSEPPSSKYNEFLGRAGRIQLRWTVFVVATLLVCAKFGFQLTI
jgi:1,4-dihydroxy-2-naphthoate octaprenyltransferase